MTPPHPAVLTELWDWLPGHPDGHHPGTDPDKEER